MSLKTCPICGKEFEAKGSQRYCSPKCKKAGTKNQKHDYYIMRKIEDAKAEAQKAKALYELDKLEELVERTTKLDRKLEELHKSGQSYADAQKAETIKQFARVEIPETPEAPKPLTVYVDPDKVKDEDLAKGGLGGHGPTVCIITPAEPEKPAERKEIMYIEPEMREFLSELKGVLNIISAYTDNENVMDLIGDYVERISKTLRKESKE